MTETTHTRSRRASLAGLVLQIVTFAALYVISHTGQAWSVHAAAWFVGAGIPIWFAALLVFRQRELAQLEALDLEALRRERQATGGGEAFFEEGGSGALSFRVAEARLRWMERFLVPFFGLLSALFLLAMGSYLLLHLRRNGLMLDDGAWPVYRNVPFHLIALAVLGLPIFLYSRYASGLARVPEWQMLRAGGSYALASAIVIGASGLTLGIFLYAQNAWWERLLAWLIPALMLVLAIELLLNLLLEVYRPRTAGKAARAPFDSRLLGLVSEPGGLAGAIAEALNYQFGFQVSQTWFYQLLQRTFLPLVGVGLLALWLLTTVVIVLPFEHALVERFGVQLHPERPLGPGVYFKLPWPIDIARKYNTGELHQLFIGFKQFDAEAHIEEDIREGRAMQWTDQDHLGQPHFDFLLPTPRDAAARSERGDASGPRTGPADQSVPVYMMRMNVAVQYRIRPEELGSYALQRTDPELSLRNIAWEEISRYMASADYFALLGDDLGRVNAELHTRIAERAEAAGLGLAIVYVGIANAHPAQQVAEAFRDVIKAEQERLAAIRNALVEQTRKLAETAGDRSRALLLSQTIDQAREAASAVNEARTRLPEDAASEALLEALAPLQAPLEVVAQARMLLKRARLEQQSIREDIEYGLGARLRDRDDADAGVRAAQQELAAAEEALAAATERLRASLPERWPVATVAAAERLVFARVEQSFWNRRLEEQFRNLQGSAAATLAGAEAQRWEIQMGDAADVARVLQEREAYRIAPEIYRTRRYLDTVSAGLQRARKVLLMFNPAGRGLKLRINAEEELGLDTTLAPTDAPTP